MRIRTLASSSRNDKISPNHLASGNIIIDAEIKDLTEASKLEFENPSTKSS